MSHLPILLLTALAGCGVLSSVTLAPPSAAQATQDLTAHAPGSVGSACGLLGSAQMTVDSVRDVAVNLTGSGSATLKVTNRTVFNPRRSCELAVTFQYQRSGGSPPVWQWSGLTVIRESAVAGGMDAVIAAGARRVTAARTELDQCLARLDPALAAKVRKCAGDVACSRSTLSWAEGQGEAVLCEGDYRVLAKIEKDVGPDAVQLAATRSGPANGDSQPAAEPATPLKPSANAPPSALRVGVIEDNPPWDCDACAEVAASATSSSTLIEGKRTYSAGLAVDDNDKTAWCEGVSGIGVGEWLELRMPAVREMVGVSLIPFYAASQSAMFNNGRVTGIRVTVDGADLGTVSIADPDRTPWGTAQMDYPTDAIVFAPTVRGTVVRLTVTSVQPGDKYQDTCLSSVGIWAKP